ncbi:MAG: NTP transferase domain-containing protein [Actinomycetota bacterium]|nr:NTP transferase domain-containing protein [Actinomycetota bacterium]MDQ3647908.1 NTP transferase domain-containing protein [Actinomycetota bacterium]
MIGAVLAGGAGRRLGRGSKAAVQVRGRALVSRPLEALGAVCERVAVVCKPGTELPELGAVERWDEPGYPQHPLIGITHALERAGEPVLVCAADMAWVTADSCRSLVNAARAGDGAPAVAVAGGVLQPVFGVYSPVVLDTLRAAESDAALTATVEVLDPVRVALPPPLIRRVNTPEDLAALSREPGGR